MGGSEPLCQGGNGSECARVNNFELCCTRRGCYASKNIYVNIYIFSFFDAWVWVVRPPSKCYIQPRDRSLIEEDIHGRIIL